MFSLFLITVHLKSRIPKNLVFGRCHILFIRSILEYCAVVWHSSLTCEQSADIERVQKVATRTILQDFNVPYETALSELHLEKLDERRKQLCLNFAKQCTKSEKNMHMFPLNPKPHYEHAHQVEKYKVPMAFTERYKESAIPYMTRLLNENSSK